MSDDTINRMDVAEFRKAGFLQEVNRQFLHPLGLALEVVQVEDGSERLGGVWDYRDDPEGVVFVDGPDADKAQQVADEHESHAAHRRELWGWVIQPVGQDVDPDGPRRTA